MPPRSCSHGTGKGSKLTAVDVLQHAGAGLVNTHICECLQSYQVSSSLHSHLTCSVHSGSLDLRLDKVERKAQARSGFVEPLGTKGGPNLSRSEEAESTTPPSHPLPEEFSEAADVSWEQAQRN